MDFFKHLFVILFLLVLSACQSLPTHELNSEGKHLVGEGQEKARISESSIPSLIRYVPYLPEPSSVIIPQAKYSINANKALLADVLLALAKDANINIDVHGDLQQKISINAVEQTVDKILYRFENQGLLRFEREGDLYTVYADTEYQKTYKIPYLNIERDAQGYVSLSMQLDGGQQDQKDNRSTMKVESYAKVGFWKQLESNLAKLIKEGSFVISPSTGVVNITADKKTHENASSYLKMLIEQSHRQVLVEATIVEVNLNRNSSTGVDWTRLARSDGWSLAQNFTDANLDSSEDVFSLAYQNSQGDFDATVKLLEEFGDVKVLSSPKIMALNNQPSILKVVDNRVYFTLNVESSTASGGATQTAIETKVNTIPVGFSMALTPYISDKEEVLLNIRPSISRIVKFVNDPSPLLAEENIVSAVPEVQVREIETVLKLKNGQIAVLGGLMQDALSSNVSQLPKAGNIPVIGEFFKGKRKQLQTSELLVFLKPVIIDSTNSWNSESSV